MRISRSCWHDNTWWHIITMNCSASEQHSHKVNVTLSVWGAGTAWIAHQQWCRYACPPLKYRFGTCATTLMIDIIANGSYLVESGLKMKHVVFWGYNRLMSVKGLGPPPELRGLSVQSFQVINKRQNMIYKRCFYTWHEHLLPLHQERVRTWCSPTVMRSVALTCWRVNTHRSFPLWRTQWPWM